MDVTIKEEVDLDPFQIDDKNFSTIFCDSAKDEHSAVKDEAIMKEEPFIKEEPIFPTEKVHAISYDDSSCSKSENIIDVLLKDEVCSTSSIDLQNHFICGLCGKKLQTKKTVTRHIMGIHFNRKYNCKHCERFFIKSDRLQKHLRGKCHTPLRCQHCGDTFTDKILLKKHKTSHGGKHICDLCGIQCTRLENLKIHVLKHLGEKPYQCKLCGKSFTEKGMVSRHLRIHTRDTRFKCRECGTGFTRRDHLKTHMRIHSGVKPYECTYCGVSCSQSSSLKTHIRIHTGEKPYKCTLCVKTFTRSDHLSAHMSRIHGTKKQNVR